MTLEPRKKRRILTVGSTKDRVVYDSFGLDLCKYYEGPMYSGHIHTVLGGCRAHGAVMYNRERVTAEDGNPLCIDYLSPTLSDDASSRAFVLILPGLLGSSQSTYVRRMATLLSSKGFYVAVLNARGVGDTPLEKPQLFSAVYTADLRHVLQTVFQPQQLQQRMKTNRLTPLFALGFSLGGVILCKYLGEQGLRGEPSQLSAAISMMAPFDLNAADGCMECSLYNRVLVKDLCAYTERHRTVMENLPNVDTARLFKGDRLLIHRMRSVLDFDRYITAPHFGFQSAEEYYNAANCFASLETSNTPVLCISTRDDPYCGKMGNIRRWEKLANNNANVTYVELPTGGHLGLLGSPVAELRGQANEGERLVLRSFQNFSAGLQM